MPRLNVNHGAGSDLKVRMPSSRRVSFSGVSTDAVVDDVYGGMRVGPDSGEINVEHNKERLIINTASGDIEVKELTGKARILTVSGDLNLA